MANFSPKIVINDSHVDAAIRAEDAHELIGYVRMNNCMRESYLVSKG